MTRTRTGFVSVVQEKRFKHGPRFTVWLLGPLPLYTWHAAQASLCDRARVLHRAVTITTEDTAFGEEIQTVELAGSASPDTEVA